MCGYFLAPDPMFVGCMLLTQTVSDITFAISNANSLVVNKCYTRFPHSNNADDLILQQQPLMLLFVASSNSSASRCWVWAWGSCPDVAQLHLNSSTCRDRAPRTSLL